MRQHGSSAFLPALLFVLALTCRRSLHTSAARIIKPGSSYLPSLDDQLPVEKAPADATPPNPCGHFDSDDPLDAGNAHQPCYGPDGEVADNSLNANTGAECGYFFPEITGYAGRMLAANATGHACPPRDRLSYPLGPGSTSGCPTSGTLFCSYPALPNENPNDFFCNYDASTGQLTQDNDAGYCLSSAPACS
ncbi:hypothetical protein KFL_006540050 [Klebsormidium nitens]|uniref:Uncharacterized protein n=1 Tax=Klebsormidium nitens TaxID=105231 RepID=A0A1Y1IN15_KLENI|nr:hypothetical protein KFL_006540050 [Klebsormidium nitens]|eukprot:GAQ90551.1 hypothetical protein KFL_006540050 [Klebsormidium nitens]